MEQVYGVWAVRSAASMFGHAEAWCKEDGRPLEFESLEVAQAYALELNRKATANIRYFVKEKEPEPNAVRVPASQPDIEAVGPVDRAPRNEVAEKHNEIPGRQMAPEADPVVEIRSAVHSNYANMVAMLAADNKVYLGREERYSFTPGQPGSYDNRDGSLCFVSDMPEMYYFLWNLPACRKVFCGNSPRAGKSCLRASPSRRRKTIFATRSWTWRAKRATTT